MAIPLTQLPCDARCVAKGRLVAGMDAGLSWWAAAAAAGITISEATAHRLRRVRHAGDGALDDGRYGSRTAAPSDVAVTGRLLPVRFSATHDSRPLECDSSPCACTGKLCHRGRILVRISQAHTDTNNAYVHQ
jgi:hypothetical protein